MLFEEIKAIEEEIDLPFILDDLDKIIEESKEGTERVKKIILNLKDFSHVDEKEKNLLT